MDIYHLQMGISWDTYIYIYIANKVEKLGFNDEELESHMI